MNWPTWNEAAIAAVLSIVLAQVAKRRSGKVWGAIGPAATEFALISGLYSVWRVARQLPLAQDEGAIERAHQIVRAERWLHLPTELSMQHFVLRHDVLARWTNTYYATVHVPALLAFLVWLYVRHRDHFPRWRNGLVILTGFCLVIRFVRVAPPRFLPGYVDLSTRYGMNIYGPVGTGVSDQFAAMPSIHVGWAAVVSFGIVAASPSRFRWLALFHVVATMFVVMASGNHWWLDGLVAIALLGVGLLMDTAGRRLAARWRTTKAEGDDPGPGTTTGADPELATA
ncbi:phosphatase PAP2 family protein [Aquihabitans sp. G128]|uniref:phosphatase PAP2 family protein n=1 Tax=Aquihabitans sp. G128 TaxID=2849779 RepID=UPI001C2288B4|nr:phosphatase PAP2 family protein [Aquihabitans sp. G128]QXC60763.1 phosphatase PAP2 family protein [Aquihabitans sp. G128]